MRLLHLVSTLTVLTVSLAAYAEPVTYTLSGSFSGTLGTTSFSNDKAVFSFTGDTSDIASLGGGFYTDTVGVGTVTLTGLGTATILSSDYGALGEFGGAGFIDLGTGFTVGIYDPSLGDYALTSPFSDTAYFVDGFTGTTGPEATSLGDLTITGGDFDDPTTTFEAGTGGTGTSVTPEPNSLFLLGTGVVSITALMRRRLL